eukprot:CAMPEP_0182438002 /NCGR_PEP_ID=MMETSP1167-20130531/85440_1 /TAXON_ID=2988 /ORGANISM="Mallomonas Sp, Strain CCMP3275" /LENGTH=142 /DNA_ID=CAMNT_0024631143 /DNA_START=793 /DNA_END=1221 /DNA_ORIENTATION=-
MAKFMAVVATYPHEVVRTRLREQARDGAFKYSGFLTTLQQIAREEGVRGLYGGMSMHLLRSVPNAAIMFSTYELTSRWMKKKALLEDGEREKEREREKNGNVENREKENIISRDDIERNDGEKSGEREKNRVKVPLRTMPAR